MMSISFPPGETLSLHRDCVAFSALSKGEAVACRITFEALLSLPGALARDYLATFRAHRTGIETITAGLINEGRSRRGELVLLKVDVGVLQGAHSARVRAVKSGQL
jgi:hypothetical protein